MIVPTILERWNQGAAVTYDIYSRLLKDRILFVGGFEGQVDTDSANLIIAQLLYLEAEDPDKEINLYINSPGGMVTAGLAIYDTMQYIKSDVSTICIGMAASMASFLLAAGAPGKRLALPNSEIMIHQVMGGSEGQASDIKIRTEHILKTKEKMNRIFAEHTSQKMATIEKDTDRDNFMDAEQAKKYGIIDKIIKKQV